MFLVTVKWLINLPSLLYGLTMMGRFLRKLLASLESGVSNGWNDIEDETGPGIMPFLVSEKKKTITEAFYCLLTKYILKELFKKNFYEIESKKMLF